MAGSTVIANSSFACAAGSFQERFSYDTSVPYVASATATYPERFYASGGTKTANTAFCFHDTRAGGFERFVGIGDVLPSGDPAVTAAPTAFN